ncbi:MAG TPA: BPL-N domain-containing protein [Tepidisphaeraceae bacterium]|nr:BPL-N domain-containing protein [Tepidisphaeraceae bacterium]
MSRFTPILLVVLLPLIARAAEPAAPPVRPLRVAIYTDVGGATAAPNVEKCLVPAEAYAAKRVTAAQIRAGALKDFDVIVQPGGSGSKQAETLGEEGREQIRKFVDGGGGYVGICAGAYLASSDYKWSLNILNAKVIDKEHWARGTGPVQLGLSAEGRKVLSLDKEQVTCEYRQGPLLAPGDHPTLPAYAPLATYLTEVAKKGAPAGVMKDTTAIAAAPFGKGKVIAISPHPEKTPGLEDVIRKALAHVAPAPG